MKLTYLIAAYNEERQLDNLVEKFNILNSKNINFHVYIIDNGSTDNSKIKLQRLALKYSWLNPMFLKVKGMGVAFRSGMEILKNNDYNEDDWIIFSAADLPFGFTDLNSFLEFKELHKRCKLFIGSKRHHSSVVERSLKRKIASRIFEWMRYFLLQIKVKDTQGTIFLNAQFVNVVEKINANDYFFTTELIYYLKDSTEIIEMPVILNQDFRKSKVNIFKDGINIFKQLLNLKFR